MKREYPDRPIVGVGGVVIHRRRALLIRRGCEPLKGQWSIPGGMLELGEDLAEGVRRELKEETGLDVEPLEMVAVFDRIKTNRAKGYNVFATASVYKRDQLLFSQRSDTASQNYTDLQDGILAWQLANQYIGSPSSAFPTFRRSERSSQIDARRKYRV